MKLYLVFAAGLVISFPAFAQSAKPCEELKSDIAKKLEANQVKSYTLEIIPKDQAADGKVVGSCDGGTKKIVYRKEGASPKKEDKETRKAEH